MKNYLLFICIIVTLGLKAQQSEPILSDGDLQHFIATYKPMIAEMEALGHDLDSDFDDEEINPGNMFAAIGAAMQNIAAQSDVKAILDKYDWDEQFFPKFMTIGMSFSYHKMDVALEEMTEEEKKYGEAMINMFKEQMATMVHENDLAMVKPYLDELEGVLED